MPVPNRRIQLIGLIGIALIGCATYVRHKAPEYRKARIAAATRTAQAAVEKEMVRLHEIARNSPTDKIKQWDLANFYIKFGIWDKAADQLAIIIHLDHNDQQAQIKLADVSMQAHVYANAEAYYRQVTQSAPRNIEAWQGLASALILERRFYEAMNTAIHAVELDGTNTKSRLIGATALLNYALQFPDPLSHSEYVETARIQLEQITKLMPNDGEVFYEYGRALVGLQHKQEAIAQLVKAVKLAPENGDAARLLATAYEDVEQDGNALAVINDLNARQPGNPATNDMLGQLLLRSNKPGALQLALEAFQRAVNKAPNDQYMNERLGEAQEKAADLQGARRTFEHVTQINPNRSFAFHKLALIYTRLGERVLAKQASSLAERLASNEQQFKTIQELSAKHPEDIGLHLIIADRFLALKMYAPARDEYFVVLKLDPKNKRVPRQFMDEAAREIKTGLY